MKIAVIGCGLMGKGIIQSFAVNDYKVVAVKHRENDNSFEPYLRNELDKNRINENDYNTVLRNIVFTTDIKKAADCDIVIETIVEDLEKKRELLEKLDKICKPEAILASNTSGLSIKSLAEVTNRKSKVIGMHFMSPVPVMRLVEIIRSEYTSQETFDIVSDITKKINKDGIEVKDSPCFITSRLIAVYMHEAFRMYEEGVGSAKDIDYIAKEGLGFPIGPLRLADALGVDVVLKVMENLSENIDRRYTPCELLKTMVKCGKTGKKSGEGFYTYKVK